MVISKEQFDQCVTSYRLMATRAEEVLNIYIAIHKEFGLDHVAGRDSDNSKFQYMRFQNIDFDYFIIEYDVEEYWAYGGHEHHGLDLSTKCLYSDSWQDELRGQLKEYVEATKRSEAAREAIATQAERKEYEKLKAKFGGE